MGRGSYQKGARFEYELKNLFLEKGFCVLRTGKSGVDGESPDLVCLHTTKKFALECKSIQQSSLFIDAAKMRIMQDWEKRAGLPFYVAWKYARGEYRFIPLMLFHENKSSYSVPRETARLGLSLDDLLKTKN
ncbi:MAG TPA: hypothetical protein VGQ00_00700 [Candidatus Norongarragalinales archaeon]|jgi:Holliday junction resolvase|nr:hypothetical protein [Candidatus Norongarragalinales archaeon]